MQKLDNSPRIYFRNLDTLRFLAAYMIVVLHCFFGWKAFFGHPGFITSSLSPYLLEKLEIVVHNFSFGVDIFFVISGFLITYLLLAEHKRTGKVDVVKFYIRRAFRIWPLYFLLILTAPLLTYFFFEPSPDYFYQFFFVGNFDVIEHGTKSVATDHLWSICIEEHFYLFCPLLIAFIPVKKLPQVLLSIIFVSIIFRGYISGKSEDYGMTLYMHTLSRIDVLALGSLFGYLYFKGDLKFDHPLGVRLIMYAVFTILFLAVDYGECGLFFTATVKKYFFVILAAYWAGNFVFNPKAKFTGIGRIFNGFGKVSYGIYMFNPVLIFLTLKFFTAFNWQNYFVYLAIVHALIFAVTFLSYRFLEVPFLALKEKYAVIKSGDKVENVNGDDLEEDGLQESKVITLGKVDNG